ncbi:TIGR02186 family protein [Acuticoccus sp.]|uniref:TIGR02186 family protein n=1 Tax=Acuticoccus sp. TaxID=1904378 RepID=UPI003B519234
MRRLALALALLAAAPASAESLAVALSTRSVSIGSDFSGASISLFGVIERDAQTVPRPGEYEVIVVVRGPEQRVLVQRRERRLGIWVNSAGQHFEAMPSYYGLFTTEDAAPLVLDQQGPARRLSLASLGVGADERETYRIALAHRRMRNGLYMERYGAVTLMTKTFFRTEVPLPPLVEDGTYTVFVLLFAAGTPLDDQRLTFVVSKSGFEEQLSRLSQQRPLVYGLGAVVLALVTGYVGGVVFRRG